MDKRIIYLILGMVLLAAGFFFSNKIFSSPPDCSVADVNDDGQINLVDSILVKTKENCENSWQEYSVCFKYDLNLDKYVDKKDFEFLEKCRIG